MAKGCLKRVESLFVTPDMTPLPWRAIGVVFFIQLFTAMKMTMVFSFVPKMVRSFGISEVDTGYFAGLLASSIYIAYLLLSLPWGYLGDRKGLKLVIIINLTGLAITSLAFGFSFNYSWAVVTRSLQGCFFGGVVCCKSLMFQLLDDSNMALGMSAIFSAWTTGFIIGPSLAGLLVFPCEQYPQVFAPDSIFARFPVLFPHLVSVGGLAITIVFAVLYLPSEIKTTADESTPLLKSKKFSSTVNEKHINEKNVLGGPAVDKERFTQSCTVASVPVNNSKKQSGSLLRVFKCKECVYASILYCGLALVATGNDELFPLFASTSREYHGMDFSTSQIGLILLVASVCVMAVQITVLTKIAQRVGPRKLFIWSSFFVSFFLPLIPAIALVENQALLWTLLIFQMLSRLFIAGEFLSINVLINNSVPTDLVGSANGLAFTLAAVGRLLAPSLFGSMFSWSLTNIKDVPTNPHPIGFPFDQFFTFFILTLGYLALSALAVRMPTSLDLKYKEDVEITVEVEKKLTVTL